MSFRLRALRIDRLLDKYMKLQLFGMVTSQRRISDSFLVPAYYASHAFPGHTSI